MTELVPGLELGGRFVLLRRLGEGTGATWLAVDKPGGANTVLKFGPDAAPATAPDPALAGDVRVLAAQESGGRAFLALEYLPGGDLGQFRGRAYGAFARALIDICADLAALHAAGRVHRNLKCSNVLFDGAGKARLVDLAAGRPAMAAESRAAPHHAGPQQLRGESPAPADDLYAFGVLLYELLSGEPPFQRDYSRERVLYEPAPPLIPRHAAPERLRRLAQRLLAKSAEERLPDAPAVAAELAAALAEPAEEPQPALRTAPSVNAAPRAGRRLPAAGIVLAAVGIAAVAAFAWLPSWVHQSARQREDAAVQAESLATAATSTVTDTREQSRQELAALRAQFDARFAAVDRRRAAEWSAAGLAAARDAGAAAARKSATGELAAAVADLRRGLELVAGLERSAAAAGAAARARGAAALAAGRASDAAREFDLAIAIDAHDAAAQAGRARAANLDAVLALLDGAAADEAAGRNVAAIDKYRKALALDPAVPGAVSAIARLQGVVAADAYASALAGGHAALARGDRVAAQAAFEKAQSMRPDAKEPREALALVAQGRRGDALADLAARAAAAESDERWAPAVQLYRDLLALEPTLTAAQAGQARAAPRADLDARLEQYLGKPALLLDSGGRDGAARTLADAAGISAPGPRLRGQVERLTGLLAAANQPVRVPLESDNVTDVVVYRVGRLGTFEHHEVDLLPGRYTVVGTRAGFRDVRREVMIEPGKAPAPVVIRCEEQI